MAQERRFQVEYRIQHADGRVRWVWEHGVGVRDASGRVIAIEGIVEDITARVESEQALREAERRYRSLFDNAIEGIFRTTPDGRYLDANPALARIYGFATPQELVDSLRDIKSQLYVDPERREEFMRIIKTRGEISGFESRVYRKNGDMIWISENARAVFDDEGRVLHYEGTVEDITERRQNQARIEQQANYDSLTGLANRSLLNDRLQQAIYTAASYGARLAVVFVDLDRFKYINDTLGHDVGDRLLQVMAERLTSAVAESDTVARLGGDEFVLLLHGHAGPDTVATVLERLLPTISAPLRYGQSDLEVTCSIGVALYPDDGSDPATLLKHADSAMYRAKEQGRNNFQFFTEDLNRAIKERFDLESQLRRALERGQFELHYQPRVDLHDAQDHRRRGADPLASAGPRHGIAGDVHSGRRGDRPHRPDQRVGAASGVRAEQALARRRLAVRRLREHLAAAVSRRRPRAADRGRLERNGHGRPVASRSRSPRARSCMPASAWSRCCTRSRSSACTSPSTISAPATRA